MLKKKLHERLLPKQKRIIRNNYLILKSLENYTCNIDEINNIGFLSSRISVKGKEFYLKQKALDSMNVIVDFVSEEYKRTLGYDDVYKVLKNIIESDFNESNEKTEDDFINQLEISLNNIVHVYRFVCRVEGLALSNKNNYKLGNFVLKHFSDNYYERIKDDEIRKAIDLEFKDKLIITGVAKGSEDYALKKFYNDADLSLSILRLYSIAFFTKAISEINLRIINNDRMAYKPALSFGWIEGGDYGFTLIKKIQSKQDLPINREFIRFIESNFFHEIVTLINKESRNEIEEALLKSIFWIGEAQKDNVTSSSYVKLWYAVESIFSKNNEELTEKNAIGISSILIYGGYRHEDFDDYNEIKKRIIKYYKIRCKIAHRAEYQNVSKELLQEFSYITSWLIIGIASLLPRGYMTLDQIYEQIDRLDVIENKIMKKKLINTRQCN